MDDVVPSTYPERVAYLVDVYSMPQEDAIRSAMGDSIVGFWYCPFCPTRPRIYPNTLRIRYRESGVPWDGKCTCGAFMDYDEEA